MKKIIALTKYDDKAASTRQRYLQYTPYLNQSGISLEVSPFFDNTYLTTIFNNDKVSKLKVSSYYINRIRDCYKLSKFDAVWLQFEFLPYFPAFFENLCSPKNIPLVIDFDDAIFHQYDEHRSPVVRRLLGKKLIPNLQKADKIFCGNSYIKEYVERYCAQVELIPTIVNTDEYVPKENTSDNEGIVIGWIGSPSTFSFVIPYVPLLEKLAAEFDITIKIIGAEASQVKSSRIQFISWSSTEEVSIIQSFDIGIMPLPDEPWARGKCGYKLIQYMACGLPVVASPVGINCEIVHDGENGFLASNFDEWEDVLRKLVTSKGLRKKMGKTNRKKIEENYSLHVYGPKIANLFDEVMNKNNV